MHYQTDWTDSETSTETIYIQTRINNDFMEYKATCCNERDLLNFLQETLNFIVAKTDEYPYLIKNSVADIGLFGKKEIKIPRVLRGVKQKKDTANIYCADWKIKRIIK